jgi:predicted TIM-barrel enzyme
LTLEESAERIQAIYDAANKVNPDIIVLCHGGPIANPADVAQIFQLTKGIAGFFGASSMERLATEVAIQSQVEQFKSLLPK